MYACILPYSTHVSSNNCAFVKLPCASIKPNIRWPVTMTSNADASETVTRAWSWCPIRNILQWSRRISWIQYSSCVVLHILHLRPLWPHSQYGAVYHQPHKQKLESTGLFGSGCKRTGTYTPAFSKSLALLSIAWYDASKMTPMHLMHT